MKCSNFIQKKEYFDSVKINDFEIFLLVWILTPYTSHEMPRMHDFAQAIVLQSYFMEIITLISISLQLSHNGSSKLLKNFSKSSFSVILIYHC